MRNKWVIVALGDKNTGFYQNGGSLKWKKFVSEAGRVKKNFFQEHGGGYLQFKRLIDHYLYNLTFIFTPAMHWMHCLNAHCLNAPRSRA